ncbi:Hypothetical predicted protein [Pelobates cultripes]|uniref:Uncharacterized protein n=1 Tax=Pelobates cultripes TaxID=61616 RepID=A0AAD1WV67_PELCU|nr:Hypothetical predicted protein [Pelobates cultripes]
MLSLAGQLRVMCFPIKRQNYRQLLQYKITTELPQRRLFIGGLTGVRPKRSPAHRLSHHTAPRTGPARYTELTEWRAEPHRLPGLDPSRPGLPGFINGFTRGEDLPSTKSWRARPLRLRRLPPPPTRAQIASLQKGWAGEPQGLLGDVVPVSSGLVNEERDQIKQNCL